MRRVLLILTLMAAIAPAVRAARDGAGGESAPRSAIEQLIAELGSDQYAVRRRAEEQLVRLGPEAFDALKAAEGHADLEIADRVQYIVQRMKVQWIRPDDVPEVRRLLTRFGDLSEAARAERIAQLAKLPNGGGLAALCRVARYDASPLAARRAALAAIKLDLSAEARQAAAAVCLQELGGSARPPVTWIQLYLRELAEPQETIAAWMESNAAEAALLKADKGDTDFVIVYDLLERHLGRCHELKLVDETMAAILARIDLTATDDLSEQLSAGLAWALRWIIDHKQWDVLTKLEDQFEGEFAKSRGLLYYLAAAARKAGREQQAQGLADKAFELSLDDEKQRVGIAGAVAELGFIDWAEREYRRAIKQFPVIDQRSMEARSDLAMWLHDREDYQGAADLLGEFCDAADADPPARRRLIEEINEENSSGRELLSGVAARRLFYLACVDEQRKDYDSQRTRLEEAATTYEKDPDILIAMYRVPGSDEAFQRRTRTRIQRVSQSMQGLIDEYPEYPGFYNQWAWLVANTEGDHQLAVTYSKKSLELAPEEPSYLDTLGRCYYAVGDLENAVKSQRRAVELSPHYRVMQRQLALFEGELADKASK